MRDLLRFALIAFVATASAVGSAEAVVGFAEGRAQPLHATTAEARLAPTAPDTLAARAGGAVIKASDGHFWADATVDGHQVRFLVDTGSTAVALTADDARDLGIDPDSLDYQYTVMTANGPARAAAVKLGLVSVGRAEVTDVQAYVIDKGLETSLLGMSYLGRLSKFEATPDALVLRS